MRKIITLLACLSLYSASAMAFDDGATYGTARTEINAKVAGTLFDAYTMLYADTDNTPAALSITANTIPGRLAAGIVAPPVDASGDCAAGSACFGGHEHSAYETAWGTVTTRDADATPLVADHGIYSLTNTGALTVTDLVDADGDHSDFVAGDQVILILSDADITLDCSENASLECFGGNDFTASATQITSHHFTFDGTRWVGPSVPMSSPTTLALSGIQSITPTVGDPDTVTFTTAAASLYGGKFAANAAGTYAHTGALWPVVVMAEHLMHSYKMLGFTIIS